MQDEIDKLRYYFDSLWPICRSVAGSGFRQSLDILSKLVPFQKLEFPSGSTAFDWTVPDEWNPKDAYLIDPNGVKRADFKKSNIHLVSHSTPFRGRLPLAELKKHIHSYPELPDAIPYVTSYYKKTWGFCLSHNELNSLPEGEYEAVIDAELKPGTLVTGEAVLPGQSSDEILLSTYLCHPSLANNELSGPLALALLYERIARLPNRKYTYRFVVSAETIGTICYLSVRGEHLRKHVKAGYQLTCVGDRGDFTFKKSRRGDTLADRAALDFLSALGRPYKVEEFDPGNGSDERQYCSPGFNLPVASLMRTMYGRYPEYHTSLDNADLLSFESLIQSVNAYEAILKDIESREIYTSTNPMCEPRLGPRGLYPQTGDTHELGASLKAIMWVINFSDGEHDLLTISRKSKIPIELIRAAARRLLDSKLIR